MLIATGCVIHRRLWNKVSSTNIWRTVWQTIMKFNTYINIDLYYNHTRNEVTSYFWSVWLRTAEFCPDAVWKTSWNPSSAQINICSVFKLRGVVFFLAPPTGGHLVFFWISGSSVFNLLQSGLTCSKVYSHLLPTSLSFLDNSLALQWHGWGLCI